MFDDATVDNVAAAPISRNCVVVVVVVVRRLLCFLLTTQQNLDSVCLCGEAKCRYATRERRIRHLPSPPESS